MKEYYITNTVDNQQDKVDLQNKGKNPQQDKSIALLADGLKAEEQIVDR